MRIKLHSLFAATVIGTLGTHALGALTLEWVRITPIDPAAFTTPQKDNTTANATLPFGPWNTWELRMTQSEGSRFGVAALRFELPTGGSLFRGTVIEPDDGVTPINLPANQLFSPTARQRIRLENIRLA